MCNEVGTCDWILQVAHNKQATKWCTRVKHTEKLSHHASYSTTGQKVQTSHSVSSRLGLMTQSSREAKSLVYSVMEKLTPCIPFSLQYKYPLYPWNVERFQREFWERNPREKQNWLIHNFYIMTLQIPQLSPFPLYILERYIRQNLFSPYQYLWEGYLVLGKQLERDQLIIVDVMGYSGIR